MASVTYGKCYLWQKYYVKCNYGKNIMANETEPSVILVDIEDDDGGNLIMAYRNHAATGQCIAA